MTMIDRHALIGGAASTAVAAMSSRVPALAAGQRPVSEFPKGFLWGASTAAHQVEGNNLSADRWVIENLPGTIFADRSGDAANSFELWPTDLDIVKRMGLNSYRFNLEWARVEPDKGQFCAGDARSLQGDDRWMPRPRTVSGGRGAGADRPRQSAVIDGQQHSAAWPQVIVPRAEQTSAQRVGPRND